MDYANLESFQQGLLLRTCASEFRFGIYDFLSTAQHDDRFLLSRIESLELQATSQNEAEYFLNQKHCQELVEILSSCDSLVYLKVDLSNMKFGESSPDTTSNNENLFQTFGRAIVSPPLLADLNLLGSSSGAYVHSGACPSILQALVETNVRLERLVLNAVGPSVLPHLFRILQNKLVRQELEWKEVYFSTTVHHDTTIWANVRDLEQLAVLFSSSSTIRQSPRKEPWVTLSLGQRGLQEDSISTVLKLLPTIDIQELVLYGTKWMTIAGGPESFADHILQGNHSLQKFRFAGPMALPTRKRIERYCECNRLVRKMQALIKDDGGISNGAVLCEFLGKMGSKSPTKLFHVLRNHTSIILPQ